MPPGRGPKRRKDSSQMWEESERTRPARDSRDTRDTREPRPPRDSRDNRERDDRRRSYRSRSRERERGGRGGARHNGEGRDRERDRALGSSRHQGETSLPYRGRSMHNDADYRVNGEDGRVRERRRSRSRDGRRSRSPRLDKDFGRDRPTRETVNSYDKNAAIKSIETQDPNRMEVDRPAISRSTDISQPAATSVTPQPEIKTANTVENNYDEDIEVEIDPDVAAMQAMMGFGGFGSTQNKKVAGNDVSAVRKEKKIEYRQYMNRVGGFNRPLSPSRD